MIQIELQHKVYKGLSDYLGCDILEFLEDHGTVFGGATRDIVAGDKINDLDIVTDYPNDRVLIQKLNNMGFYTNDKLNNCDSNIIYKETSIIKQPLTFIKMNYYSAPTIVQLIRPYYRISQIITQVDMVCSGICFDKRQNLFEAIPHAISHSKEKFIEVLPNNAMYHGHIIHKRTSKLCNRGWRYINEEGKKRIKREDNLKELVNIFNI